MFVRRKVVEQVNILKIYSAQNEQLEANDDKLTGLNFGVHLIWTNF